MTTQRKFDGMDIYRAHLALQRASNDALIQHHRKGSEFHLRYCKEHLAEAAAYLGFELVESETAPIIRHIDEMLFNEAAL